MKIVYFGGGSIRNVARIRHLLTLPAMRGGTIVLYDLSQDRADMVAKVCRQVPEYADSEVAITSTTDLDRALDGADVVQMTACTWSRQQYQQACKACISRGFMGTDNLSLVAAHTVPATGQIVLDLVERLRKASDHAVIIFFTNPISVLTGIVHRAVGMSSAQPPAVRAFGVCGGAMNHAHDICHMLGWDAPRTDFDLEVAGINHLSWLMKLELDGRDFYPVLREGFEKGIDQHVDRLKDKGFYSSIKLVYPQMVHAYRVFGKLLFSSEPDGLSHLCYHDQFVEWQRTVQLPRSAAIENGVHKAVGQFAEVASRQLDDTFWNDPKGPSWRSAPEYALAGVQIIDAITSDTGRVLTASYPNQGAITDLRDDDVAEYTMHISRRGVKPHGSYPCALPAGTRGTTTALAAFQSLLARSVVEQDARVFEQALYEYPMSRERQKLRQIVDELRQIFAPSLPDGVTALL